MLAFLLHGGLRRIQKYVFKLFVCFCFDVFAIQLDLLTRSIATALYSFVIGSFLQFLCIKYVLAANFYQLSQLFS